MGFAVVQRIVGFLIAGSSLMMLPPVGVSLLYHDGTATLFLVIAAILAIASPLASSHPDGLEWVAEQNGFLSAA